MKMHPCIQALGDRSFGILQQDNVISPEERQRLQESIMQELTAAWQVGYSIVFEQGSSGSEDNPYNEETEKSVSDKEMTAEDACALYDEAVNSLMIQRKYYPNKCSAFLRKTLRTQQKILKVMAVETNVCSLDEAKYLPSNCEGIEELQEMVAECTRCLTSYAEDIQAACDKTERLVSAYKQLSRTEDQKRLKIDLCEKD